MYAILESGGKQVKAIPGQYIKLEKLSQNQGDKVAFGNILALISKENSKIGSPYISGAIVNGQITEQKKDKKIIVYKMRPKKGTRKKQGHRQLYSKILVENIELNGEIIAKAENTEEKASKRKK